MQRIHYKQYLDDMVTARWSRSHLDSFELSFRARETRNLTATKKYYNKMEHIHSSRPRPNGILPNGAPAPSKKYNPLAIITAEGTKTHNPALSRDGRAGKRREELLLLRPLQSFTSKSVVLWTRRRKLGPPLGPRLWLLLLLLLHVISSHPYAAITNSFSLYSNP